MRKMQKTIILSDQDIRLKIRRIAHQIHEANLEEDKVFIAGVAKSGYRIACLIKEELEKISGREVKLGELQVNKKDLFAPYKFSFDMEELSGHSVVLVDDVLNSGAVLIYAVRYLLSVPLKRLTTAVLVDRNHKRYPVKVDYKGLSLSTSLHNHVQVVFAGDGTIRAELS